MGTGEQRLAEFDTLIAGGHVLAAANNRSGQADVAIKNPDSLKKTLPDAREAARRASLAIGAK